MIKTEHCDLSYVNQTILDAVIRRTEAVCPDSVALIGIYGSAATGDTHEKSDLDLLVLINDDRARTLNRTFVLDDIGVGFDIYCTTWDMAEADARCEHAHLSRLLDARIVCIRDPDAAVRLENLREKAKACLSSDERFDRANDALQAAVTRFGECCLAQSLSRCRTWAAAAIDALLSAVMLWHGRYFRLGVKRTFEELARLGLRFDLKGDIDRIIRADSMDAVRDALGQTIRDVRAQLPFPVERVPASPENLSGTWEEMYSNWRNKMTEAAENRDPFASFMNLTALQFMFDGVAAGIDIRVPDAMAHFDPADLSGNAARFDEALDEYLREYEKIGLKPLHYADADAFSTDFCQK